MEHTYYRIGEVSRATGISKDTLHFYDRIEEKGNYAAP